MKINIHKYLRMLLSGMLIAASIPAVSFADLIRTAPDSPSLIRLSRTDDPETAMTITWQDSAEVENAWIEYTSGSSLSDAADGPEAEEPAESESVIQEKAAQEVPHASLLSDGGTQWTVTLTGLEPGTAYLYRINSRRADGESAGGVCYRSSEEYRFTTKKAEEQSSLTFAYFGDVQVNQDAESEFIRWGELAQTALKLNPDMKFGIMGGDIVESGISTEQFDMFFDAASPVFSEIPLFSAIGNHESNFPGGKAELFLDSFVLPENGPEGFKEEFYSFDYGPAHILVLNSWVYSGEQKLTEDDYTLISDWISEDLRSAADAEWKIVVMHHPLYAVHSDNVADLVQENWGPLLQEGGTDLLLCGHQHVYCRSLPLTDGITDYENGITQVMGVSGEKFYSSADELNMERTVYEVSNYQIIRINGNSMELQCFDRDGRELDYAVLSSSDTETGADRFIDVSSSDWFHDAVEYVCGKGYFNGISDTLFAPQNPMTRAMFAVVLSRMAGINTESCSRSVFLDVPEGQWYSAGIAWAAEQGIVTGTGNDRFDPEGMITREQMAVMLYRYADSMKQNVETVQDHLADYTDRAQISEYAEKAVNWAVEKDVLHGMGDGTLDPGSSAVRAHVAQIIKNYSEKIQ